MQGKGYMNKEISLSQKWVSSQVFNKVMHMNWEEGNISEDYFIFMVVKEFKICDILMESSRNMQPHLSNISALFNDR